MQNHSLSTGAGGQSASANEYLVDRNIISEVHPISLTEARQFIRANHYASVLPPHSMLRLGSVPTGCVSVWGYGVRPADTIRILMRDGKPSEYLELARLCCEQELPRNTESRFISKCVKWIEKNRPEILLLWSWADGMRGKPGFVYQASNWNHCRVLRTGWYTNGESIMHPRFFVTRYGSRTAAKGLGYKKISGFQYGYYLLLGDRRKKKATANRILLPNLPYPKDTTSVISGSVDWNLKNPLPLFEVRP